MRGELQCHIVQSEAMRRRKTGAAGVKDQPLASCLQRGEGEEGVRAPLSMDLSWQPEGCELQSHGMQGRLGWVEASPAIDRQRALFSPCDPYSSQEAGPP